MFGYIRTDIPNLYMKDNVLYKSLYCGMCKAIRKSCGEKAKFALSYDITLFSALYHNIMGEDIKINKEHCIVHPIKKIPVSSVSDLDLQLGALNTLLAYYKIKDNVIDDGKGKTALGFFKSCYKKAKKSQPELDRIISFYIDKLHEIENKKTPSVDTSADCFAEMTSKCSEIILKGFYTEEIGELFYLIGKWIYIIDALDDFDKDKKKKAYNPFIYEYDDCEKYSELLERHFGEIKFIFTATENRMDELLSSIKFRFNYDLIYNIISKGMPKKSKGILNKINYKENRKWKNNQLLR